MSLPGLTGLDLADAAAASRPGAKVLFISGRGDDVLDNRPGVAFLQKPFGMDAFLRKIQEVLGAVQSGTGELPRVTSS